MSGSKRRSSSSASRRRDAPGRRPAPRRATQPRKTRPSRLAAAGSSRETKSVGRLSVAGLGLQDHNQKRRLPAAVPWLVGVGVVALVVVAALFVMSLTPVFTITSIEADPSDHLSASDITRLASVGEGTTLLNVDTAQIEERLSKNPWVASVRVERQFPDKLYLVIEERKVLAIVTITSGNTAWYLSDAGTWIEPLQFPSTDGDLADTALSRAREEGCLLIRDVPATTSPKAGAPATDPSILGVIDYQEGFTEGLSSQVVSYSAPSEEAISCALSSGIEISLGDPSQIPSKEAVINELMAQHPGKLTYINVRNPSKPSFRQISSDSVAPGTGVQAPEADDSAADGQGQAQDGGQGGDASGGTDGGTSDGDGRDGSQGTADQGSTDQGSGTGSGAKNTSTSG